MPRRLRPAGLPTASLLAGSLLAGTLVTGGAAPGQAPGFTKEVRPILSENCFTCHGPDAARRKAKLRLDRPGWDRGDELLRRIHADDPDDRMPPPSSHKTLTAAQRDVLTRWVRAGAPYETHWAFVPPARPELPAGDAPHPIDRFIRTRLRTAGLEPAPEAAPPALLRRVYLDLVGLPPTPEEADAYLADPAPDRYERVVDRLLASPRYGERQARAWLDLARYADTNGYEKDRERSMWPYRDWVIRALNADMPFDRFTVAQLAGDMLPEETPERLIATGFHRNTMINEEGGIDPLEYRFHAMTDRVATTGTTFLGLTVGCAQCHTHKYDPISHREYYGLMAYLDNADEPEYAIPDPAAAQRERSDRAAARRALDDLAAVFPGGAGALDAGVRSWAAAQSARLAPWTTLTPDAASSNLPRLEVEQDGTVQASGDTSKHDVYRLRFDATPGRSIRALRLEALPDERLPAGGPGLTYYEGTPGDFFLAELRVTHAGRPVAVTKATESYARNRYGNNPASAALATDGDLQTGWSVHGRIGERHVAVFVLARPIPVGEPFAVEMHFGRHFASSLGRFRLQATHEPRGGEALDLPPQVEAALQRPAADRSDAESREVRDAFLLQAEPVRKRADEIRRLLRPRPRTTSLILRERPKGHTRPTHRHHRGEFMQPRERVAPGLPAALCADRDTAPADRLGFARWLVSRDNPLTARVVVNRHWAAIFGTGLVATLDDFGAQGELPSHPRLLDWLAVEFMERGWSLKQLHRLLVTSATYRQDTRRDPAAARIDPGNRLLAAAPRLRLDAEVIRDAALRASGLLSDAMFGPPVRPPQPDGVTEVAWGQPRWRASEGADRYRRSIYTLVKRTAPFAMYQTFDAPSGEACTARRDRSNTALQALTLLNDPMMHEIAAAFGADLARRARDRESTQVLATAFRRVLTRHPTAAELERVRQFYTRVEARSADPNLAWTAVARALLCLDETVTRS